MARTPAQKSWEKKNAKRIAAQKRAAYWANLEKSRAERRERQARYRRNHPDRVRKQLRADYLKNRPERLAAALAYQKANLSTTVRASRHNRRARLKNAPGRITKKIAAEIRAAQHDVCAYCPTALNGAGHLDHKQALSRGGTNYRENLQWLCEPCNLHKYTKSHEEFMREAA